MSFAVSAPHEMDERTVISGSGDANSEDLLVDSDEHNSDDLDGLLIHFSKMSDMTPLGSSKDGDGS
jgi:hypothetical protein